MRKLSIHPEVYDELESARQWYQVRSANLGAEFLDEVEFAMKSITESPELWPPYSWVKGTRHFLVHRFPFAVFNRLTGDAIQILAVGHLHRNPGYWKFRT